MVNASPAEAVDPRKQALSRWLLAQPAAWGLDLESLRPASTDASFRRYFRVNARGRADGTLVAMDAPPDKEDAGAFIQVAGLLARAGLHAPEIVAADRRQGFLLLSDLGQATYLSVLTEQNAGELFADAIAALVRWQLASTTGALAPYDRTLLQREVQLFPDWYVARHLQLELGADERETFAGQAELILRSALAQPQVYVHRDYMPRNLMVATPNPGILDFQDAVFGPITYDIASLLRDAFVSWEEERVLDWTVRYWQAARAAGLPVDPDFGEFYRAFEWMGLQRHLKVLGIFARIRYRDGKPHYLEDAPRFLRYVRTVTQRYRELVPLARLFDRLEGRPERVGCTF